ncbi:MAG: hypothetical protein QG653_217, partial [Patescibacteria group bacterium]|nr:hypothetical protein [Patescibacteria group bacterium]
DKIRSFGPDVVAVSAGFDAYKDDPILGLKFTEDGYTYAGKLIRDIGVKTFAILEGGYHKKIGSCISAFVDGFNNPQQEIGEFH